MKLTWLQVTRVLHSISSPLWWWCAADIASKEGGREDGKRKGKGKGRRETRKERGKEERKKGKKKKGGKEEGRTKGSPPPLGFGGGGDVSRRSYPLLAFYNCNYPLLLLFCYALLLLLLLKTNYDLTYYLSLLLWPLQLKPKPGYTIGRKGIITKGSFRRASLSFILRSQGLGSKAPKIDINIHPPSLFLLKMGRGVPGSNPPPAFLESSL